MANLAWDQHEVGEAANVTRLLSSAASTNDTLVRSKQTTLWHITGFNASAAMVYLKLYDKATAPTVGTDTPKNTYPIAPSTVFRLDFSQGFNFLTGLGFGLTTGHADNDTGAVASGDIIALSLEYN